MRRKRLSPKDAFFQLVHLNDDLVARLLDFGEKCSGIEISTRKVEGDWPREIPLLPVGDTWEAVDTLKVWLKDSGSYAVIEWLDSGEVNTRIHDVDLDKVAGESQRLKAAVDSVLATVRTGRPPWSGTFRSPEAFISAAKTAIAAIQRRGLYASEERVAEYFSDNLGLENCDARLVRKWRERASFKTWQDLLARI